MKPKCPPIKPVLNFECRAMVNPVKQVNIEPVKVYAQMKDGTIFEITEAITNLPDVEAFAARLPDPVTVFKSDNK